MSMPILGKVGNCLPTGELAFPYLLSLLGKLTVSLQQTVLLIGDELGIGRARTRHLPYSPRG